MVCVTSNPLCAVSEHLRLGGLAKFSCDTKCNLMGQHCIADVDKVC